MHERYNVRLSTIIFVAGFACMIQAEVSSGEDDDKFGSGFLTPNLSTLDTGSSEFPTTSEPVSVSSPISNEIVPTLYPTQQNLTQPIVETPPPITSSTLYTDQPLSNGSPETITPPPAQESEKVDQQIVDSFEKPVEVVSPSFPDGFTQEEVPTEDKWSSETRLLPENIQAGDASTGASLNTQMSNQTIPEAGSVIIDLPPTQDQKIENIPEPSSSGITTQPESEDVIEGIDTISLKEPQGNWLFKRIWWERAEEKFEKIRGIVNNVVESRLMFINKRTAIERDVLDPFYISMGLSQGELEGIISQLIAYIQGMKNDKGYRAAQENQDLISVLTQEQKKLEQLKNDVQNIKRMDDALDDVLAKIIEQINRIRGYEEEAWKQFKEISRVLNDRRARELYYVMNGIAKNIADTQIYVERTLSTYFDSVVETINTSIDRIRKMTEDLKEKGIDFKKQIELLQQASQNACVITSVEQERETPDVNQGMVSRLWDGIVWFVTSPLRWFRSSSQKPQTEEELDALDVNQQEATTVLPEDNQTSLENQK